MAIHSKLFVYILAVISLLLGGCALQSPVDESRQGLGAVPTQVLDSLPDTPPKRLAFAQDLLTPAATTDLPAQSTDATVDQPESLYNQARTAQWVLKTLTFADLAPPLQAQYFYIEAQALLILGQGEQALQRLDQHDSLWVLLGEAVQMERGLMRAEAYELSGAFLAAAQQRLGMAGQLDGEAAQINQEQLWFDVHLIDAKQRAELASQPDQAVLLAWVELAQIEQTPYSHLTEQAGALQQWLQRYPTHPAAVQLPPSLQMIHDMVLQQPRQIALLLPLSGELGASGQAIVQGILAAWYRLQRSEQWVPTIRLYDTAQQIDIVPLYQQAVAEGADAVIGPLQKRWVTALAQQSRLPVPTLALNFAQTPQLSPSGDVLAAGPLLASSAEPPAQLFQFALLPEDEAQQIARFAQQQGFVRAAIIVPEDSWGQRLQQAFAQQWLDLGGQISAAVSWSGDERLKPLLQQMLAIDVSDVRAQRLQHWLQTPLVFEPRRRQDIDFIFMAAQPAQARQIKPMLNFLYANDIPVLASSSIYSGQADTQKDNDLDAITLLALPWDMLSDTDKSALQAAFGALPSGLAPLRAMGVDAFNLYPRLLQLKHMNDAAVSGFTGRLTMDAGQRIHRELTWARFYNGSIQPLNSAFSGHGAR